MNLVLPPRKLFLRLRENKQKKRKGWAKSCWWWLRGKTLMGFLGFNHKSFSIQSGPLCILEWRCEATHNVITKCVCCYISRRRRFHAFFLLATIAHTHDPPHLERAHISVTADVGGNSITFATLNGTINIYFPIKTIPISITFRFRSPFDGRLHSFVIHCA